MSGSLFSAGVRLGRLRRAVDEENLLSRYVERRSAERRAHPVQAEIDTLRGYVDWLLYSKEGSLIFSQPEAKAATPSEAPPFRGKTSLPVVSIAGILAAPDRWADSHVIMEGGVMERVSVNGKGEHWHVMSDGTGRITAVSDGMLAHSEGTLFGVARKTDAGKQLFLEVRNFYPLPPAGGSTGTHSRPLPSQRK